LHKSSACVWPKKRLAINRKGLRANLGCGGGTLKASSYSGFLEHVLSSVWRIQERPLEDEASWKQVVKNCE
jgi:hypothetical protein